MKQPNSGKADAQPRHAFLSQASQQSKCCCSHIAYSPITYSRVIFPYLLQAIMHMLIRSSSKFKFQVGVSFLSMIHTVNLLGNHFLLESFSILTTGNSPHVGSSSFASDASFLSVVHMNLRLTQHSHSLRFRCPHLTLNPLILPMTDGFPQECWQLYKKLEKKIKPTQFPREEAKRA